jgi:predicted GNAT family N-acyltransferase
MPETLIVKFDETHAPAIRNIRNAVFTHEQHVDQDLDFDGQDRDAIHVLVAHGKEYVGTGRMLADGHIGRLAVLREHRGRGLGAEAVLALVNEAQNRGMRRVYLGAQSHAVGFYEKLGFSVYGDPYVEVNIEHIHMERLIPPTP